MLSHHLLAAASARSRLWPVIMSYNGGRGYGGGGGGGGRGGGRGWVSTKQAQQQPQLLVLFTTAQVARLRCSTTSRSTGAVGAVRAGPPTRSEVRGTCPLSRPPPVAAGMPRLAQAATAMTCFPCFAEPVESYEEPSTSYSHSSHPQVCCTPPPSHHLRTSSAAHATWRQ
jgi:hypothetical protein